MDPSRKRKLRLVIALSMAVLLAGALVYTSFGSSTAAKEPSQVLAAGNSERYELTGKVVVGSVDRSGESMRFRVRDREGTESVPVSYSGVVSDTFRDGREVILKGRLQNGVFVGERDSLTTKCPSKFQNKKNERT